MSYVGFSTQLASDLFVFIDFVYNLLRDIPTFIFHNPYLFLMFGFVVAGLSISLFGYLSRG